VHGLWPLSLARTAGPQTTAGGGRLGPACACLRSAASQWGRAGGRRGPALKCARRVRLRAGVGPARAGARRQAGGRAGGAHRGHHAPGLARCAPPPPAGRRPLGAAPAPRARGRARCATAPPAVRCLSEPVIAQHDAGDARTACKRIPRARPQPVGSCGACLSLPGGPAQVAHCPSARRSRHTLVRRQLGARAAAGPARPLNTHARAQATGGTC